VFIDAINVKIREGQVANRPVYLALGVTVDGERDVLGLWAGEHGDGEGAKFWLRVLSEIKNRGTRDVLMVVCDGLKGLPDAVNAVWDKTIVQTCIVHLLRNSFKYASRRDWGVIAKDLRPVYNAASEAEALDRFAEFSGKWEKRYPAIIRLWENAWAEFVPFLQFDREIRTVICTTNAIESINARLRRAVNARGHFPTEQAALKCLYLAIRSLDPTGRGRKRWTNRWKAALNAFDITFDGRLSGTQVTKVKEVTPLKLTDPSLEFVPASFCVQARLGSHISSGAFAVCRVAQVGIAGLAGNAREGRDDLSAFGGGCAADVAVWASALIRATMAGWRRSLSRQQRRLGPMLPTGMPSLAPISAQDRAGLWMSRVISCWQPGGSCPNASRRAP
jgi:hypothetical protein